MDGKISAVAERGWKWPFTRQQKKFGALPYWGKKLPENFVTWRKSEDPVKILIRCSAREPNKGIARVVSTRVRGRQHEEPTEENALLEQRGGGVWEGARKNPARPRRVKIHAMHPFTSPRPQKFPEQEHFPPRRTKRNCVPPSRDTPPKRDTGIASEKDWGINLLNESINESGTNEDGSSWYRESGEDIGENGYRCRWSVMGGRNADDTSEWREAVCKFNIKWISAVLQNLVPFL